MVIDAPKGALPHILKNKDGLELEKLVLTHSHWDHILDASKIAQEFKIPIWMHKKDSRNATEPGSDRLPIMDRWQSFTADHFVEDGEIFTLGELSIKVIHTPGHSLGGICLYIAQKNTLFSGDTLFAGCMGRVDLPTSDPELMWKSLKILALLPKETKVFPGHGDSTTIGEEDWLDNARERFQM